LLEQRGRAAASYWTDEIGPVGLLPATHWQYLLTRCYFHETHDDYVPIGPLPLLLLTAALLSGLLVGKRRGRVLVALGVAGPVVLALAVSESLGRNILVDRHFVAPFSLLLVGAALLTSRLPRTWQRWTAAAAVTAVLALSSFRYERDFLDLAHRPGACGAADRIAADWQDGDTVVALNPFAYFPLKYHAAGRFPSRQLQPVRSFPAYEGGPVFQADDLVSREELQAIRGGRVWTVAMQTKPNQKVPPTWQRRAEWVFPEPAERTMNLVLTLWEVTD
jgi:hypothetical protein